MGPGRPWSSGRARWLELFPGPAHDVRSSLLCCGVTASLSTLLGRTVPLAWVQLKHSAWEAAALEGWVLQSPLLLHLLVGWPHRDPPVPSLVPPTQQKFNQWVGTEGDISLVLGQTLL